MPTYDYRCAACGHAEEIFHGMSEKPRKTCPKCKKPKFERLVSGGAGFLFKGEGFYLTDYRSESYKAGQKADSGAPAPTTDASSSSANSATTSKSPASAADSRKSSAAKPGKKSSSGS